MVVSWPLPEPSLPAWRSERPRRYVGRPSRCSWPSDRRSLGHTSRAWDPTTTVTESRATALTGVDLRALCTDVLGAGNPCPSPAHRGAPASPAIEVSTGARPWWRCPGGGDGGSAVDLISLVLGCGADEAITRLQQWMGGAGDEAGERVLVDAAPTGVHLRPRPFALTVAGGAWREVVVEAEPSATVGDLADALGLDPANGLELAGEIVDRSRPLTVAGLRQGDVLRPAGLSAGTSAAVARRAPVGLGLPCRTGRPARGRRLADRRWSGGGRRRLRGDERRGHGARSRTGRVVGPVGGRVELSVGTVAVLPAGTVTGSGADTPWMDPARRAIASPARSEAAGTRAPRSARHTAPPGLAVPGAGRRVTRRWDRARRRTAAGARAHARRPGRHRHAGHVRMAAVAVAATAGPRTSCP